MTIEVSVIIPTFNREQTLPRALRSVLGQTGVAFEILVIDDGSQDNTADLVRRDFPSADYFYQTRQGPAAARNRGLQAARGEWIAFLDSDDEWLPEKLKTQLEFFRDHPDCRINQTEEIWIRNGRRVNPMQKHQKFGGWIFEKCLPLCLISPSAVMIHRSVFEHVGLFDETYPACEDYELWLRISAVYPVGLIETPYLRKYGGHPDQRSREYPAMDRFRIRALVKILKAGSLNPEQEQAARLMLEGKVRIFRQGALKRKNQAWLSELEEILTGLTG